MGMKTERERNEDVNYYSTRYHCIIKSHFINAKVQSR